MIEAKKSNILCCWNNVMIYTAFINFVRPKFVWFWILLSFSIYALFVWSFPHILSSVFVPKARNLQWMCIYRRVSPRLCVRSEAFWEWMKFVIDSVDRLGFEWGKEATCIACRVFIFYVLLFSLDGNWFWPLSIRLNFYD